ncbi:MAG: citrate/2-methylcitrate synthase [Ruminococcaceae bacterium]|nr:citrate/2-methylcitrate synthase [Oscillospiraceae bacterium]
MANNPYSVITPYIEDLAAKSCCANGIMPEMYAQHNVKRGLRDLHGRGVLTGLTEISEVISHKIIDGVDTNIPGELCYRGINVKDLTAGCMDEDRYGFEECVYLLLFGTLPTQDELLEFCGLLSRYRSLPTSFPRDVIMKAPSKDMMNTLARSVLTLYSYDDNPDDISIPNVLRQCLQLIAIFPMLAVYGYHSFKYYHEGQSLYIHPPKAELSTAQNLLHMLRPDGAFTETEARTLDLALVLHAEHGGGNNSTFTTHVVSSSGTDTYSSVAASLGSLKGPRHGGANIKVVQMFDDMKANISDWSDDSVRAYLTKILNKEAFDRAGLIYGLGHAIYSVSDPRAEVLKSFAKKLSIEKGMEEEYDLYKRTARIASDLIAQRRKIYKGVSPNVDFYSGMIYRMLNLPEELYTPLFAVARIAGWSAHRIEELQNAGKIIRPAYMCVKERRDYVPLSER